MSLICATRTVCYAAEADGAVSVSMAGVSAYSQTYSAPEGAIADTSFSVCVSYSNLYFLPELGEAVLSTNLPFKTLGVSLFVSRFGCDAYSNTDFGIVLWRRFASFFGLALRYGQSVHSHAELDTPQFLFRLTPGAFFAKNDHTIGIHASIVSIPDIDAAKNIHPSVCLYYKYLLCRRCDISAEFEYDEYGRAIGRIAIDCGVNEVFALRGGVRVPDIRPSFGLGFRIRRVSVDFGADYAPNLGCRAGVGVKCLIAKRSRDE